MEWSRLVPRTGVQRALLIGSAIVSLQLLPASAEGPIEEPNYPRYEEQFLADMIGHHLLAVRMAEIGREKAAHRELAELCGAIADARSDDVARLESLLDEWYGVSSPAVLRPTAEKREAMLQRVSGDVFEASLLDMMIVHGEEAVDEATACLERVLQPEVLSICAGIVEEQAAEVEAMQDWLCRWHDVGCDHEW